MALAFAQLPAPNTAAAWSSGYASFVGRFCHGYALDTLAMSRDGGLPFGSEPEWTAGGSASDAFHDGGSAAQGAFRRDQDFCTRPSAAAGSHAETVRRYLKLATRITKRPATVR